MLERIRARWKQTVNSSKTRSIHKSCYRVCCTLYEIVITHGLLKHSIVRLFPDPHIEKPLLPRPIAGLTSSSSGWQWCLGCRSWQRWRLFSKPFLSVFSPFFTRGHSSPLTSLVAGLSVIAGQRLWSRYVYLHVGTRCLPVVQGGDSIRAVNVYNHTTNSLTHATHTYNTHAHNTHSVGPGNKSRQEINAHK